MILTEIRKSQVKTVRLDRDTVELLRKAARKQRISENALVTETLAWKLKVYPLLPTFNGIVLWQDALSSILALTNGEGLEAMGYNLGKKHFSLARELFDGNGMELTFLQFLEDILGGHAKWFEVEGDIAERPRAILLRHDCGRMWSLFLTGYLKGACKIATRNEMLIEATESLLKLRFAIRPADSDGIGS